MRTSETIGALAKDLAKAQLQLKNAVKSAENPHFKNKYADLAVIRDTTATILGQHNLSIVQAPGFDEHGHFMLFTRMLHSTGEWIEAVYPLPHVPEKPQLIGAAMTYGRRYSWSAICAIAAGLDDDGEASRVYEEERGTLSNGSKNHNFGSKEAMSDLVKGPDGPSAYVSGPVWKVVEPQIKDLPFSKMGKWWDTVAAPATLAHSWKRQLFINFMLSACVKAPSAKALTEFWEDFKDKLADIEDVSKSHYYELEDAYNRTLDNLSTVNAG